MGAPKSGLVRGTPRPPRPIPNGQSANPAATASAPLPSTPAHFPSGAPGSGNPRKRMRLSEDSPPARHPKAGPDPAHSGHDELQGMVEQMRTPSPETDALEFLETHAKPAPSPSDYTVGEVIKLPPDWTKSAPTAQQDHEFHALIDRNLAGIPPESPQHQLLLRMREVTDPAVGLRLRELFIPLTLRESDFSKHAHAINKIKLLLDAHAVSMGHPTKIGVSDVYQTLRRQFYCNQLEDAVAQDPVVAKLSPAAQDEQQFIAQAVFNTALDLGSCESFEKDIEPVCGLVQNACKLGVDFDAISARVLDTSAPKFYEFCTKEGSPLRDRLFPGQGSAPLTKDQNYRMLAVLCLGRPQGAEADQFDAWFGEMHQIVGDWMLSSTAFALPGNK
jgi:hypothetical protein